jgi:hypothetical protein
MQQKSQWGPVLAAQWASLLWARTVGRAQQNARLEVFKGGQTYRDGVVRTLNRSYSEYKDPGTSKSHRELLGVVALQDLGDYPVAELPEHLQTWVRSLQNPAQGERR